VSVCALFGARVWGAADNLPVVSVSSSPAFVLLGVTPSAVEQPGVIRDYKLDFATQAALRVPDVSFECRPFWLTWLGHDTGFTHWPVRKKMLSSFGLAAGMVNQTENTTATALAATMSLYRAADPLCDSGYVARTRRHFTVPDSITQEKDSIEDLLRDSTNASKARREEWQRKLDSFEVLKQSYAAAESHRIDSIKNDYETQNWNSAQIEIGGGVRTNLEWLTESDFQFDSAGGAFWITACTGIGPSILVSGMYRFASNLGGLDNTVGFNVRWGGPKSGLFAEVLVDLAGTKGHITYGGGGEYLVNRTVQIQYGLRSAKNGALGLAPTLGLSLMPSRS
jgi:hypothetical protein